MEYSTLKFISVSLLLLFAASNLGAARLLEEVAPEESNCWESLSQLNACTTEVLLFFLNGETYLGPGCCRAIRTIQQDCWPELLGSLGYTTEEGDILRGYCDASAAVPPPPSSP